MVLVKYLRKTGATSLSSDTSIWSSIFFRKTILLKIWKKNQKRSNNKKQIEIKKIKKKSGRKIKNEKIKGKY